jgi:hypothetical protein
MLEHLRQRVIETLASAKAVTLSTFGPADIQADVFPCESIDTELYLSVPRTSDHWLNLENNPAVVITTPTWQLRGMAQILAPHEVPLQLSLLRMPDAAWEEVVRIDPIRLQIRPCLESTYSETIEFDR